MDKKLTRSQSDKVIAGVCGGLGRYFQIDPVILRVLAVLLLLVNGFGAILYIIAWVAIPQDKMKEKEMKKDETVEETSRITDSGDNYVLISMFAILLGVLLLINNFVDIFNFHKTWPVLLIFLGIVLLARNTGENK